MEKPKNQESKCLNNLQSDSIIKPQLCSNDNDFQIKDLKSNLEPKNLINIVSFIEASTVTGPAKNLFEFTNNEKRIALDIVTFDRPQITESIRKLCFLKLNKSTTSIFVEEAKKLALNVTIIVEYFRYDFSVLYKIKNIIKKRHPSIIQTHSVKSHFIIFLSGLYKKYPWVAFHHGYTSTNKKMEFYNKLDKISLKYAKKIITVSEAFSHELEKNGINKNKITVVHNSVNTEYFEKVTELSILELKNRFNIKKEDFVLLTIGRLSKEKGHLDLINAFNLLRKNILFPSLKLIILGEGIEKPKITKLLNDHKLEDQIYLAGFDRDVRPYYKIANLFVLPSHSEGSPNVLLEAMASKVSIIATKVGGIPEMVHDGVTSLLVSPNSPESLSSAINELILDKSKRDLLVNNAYQYVCTNFSSKKRSEELFEIYNSIL